MSQRGERNPSPKAQPQESPPIFGPPLPRTLLRYLRLRHLIHSFMMLMLMRCMPKGRVHRVFVCISHIFGPITQATRGVVSDLWFPTSIARPFPLHRVDGRTGRGESSLGPAIINQGFKLQMRLHHFNECCLHTKLQRIHGSRPR